MADNILGTKRNNRRGFLYRWHGQYGFLYRERKVQRTQVSS